MVNRCAKVAQALMFLLCLSSPSGCEQHTIDGQTTAGNLDEESSGLMLVPQIGHRSFVWAVDFSPDGQTVASGSSDGTTQVWDVASGELEATMWSIVERDQRGRWASAKQWVTWTPEGYYDCSERGEHYLRYRDSEGVLHPPSEYSEIFRKPERVCRALAQ